MENKTRSFSNLIERLKDVQCKLGYISDKKLWVYTYLTSDDLRMHSNMKNVINSLVKKTVAGKCEWEDLANTDIGNKEPVEEPMFENHITSEEYIAESIKIQNAKAETNDLLKSLLSLQEMLGDTLDSSCQISNYPMKLTSGFLVQDLITVNKQYESIWQSLHSVVNLRDELVPQTEGDTFLSEVNEKLLKSIQLCFKELTKIKLEIEHFFKVNMIELQFTEPRNKSDELSKNHMPKVDCHYFTDNEAFVQNAENTNNGMMENNLVPPEIHNLSSTFSESSEFQESEISSYLFSSMSPWINFKGLHDSNQPFNYFRDFVLDDPSAFIASQIKHAPGKKDYMQPKIVASLVHSTDVIDDQNCEEINDSSGHTDNKQSEMVGSPVHHKEYLDYINCVRPNKLFGHKNTTRGQNYDQNEQNYYDDILFGDQVLDNIGYNDLPKFGENGSLFNIREEDINGTDLFDATPLQIEKSDHSYAEAWHNNHQLNMRQNDNFVRSEYQVQNDLKLMTGIQKLPQSQFLNRQGTIYPFKKSLEDENVLFDPESLVDIFQANNNVKSGSVDGDDSSFCLWPVAANYMYVSRQKRTDSPKPISSDITSFGCEDTSDNCSLQPIYLNTNYQQEENFTGTDTLEENLNDSNNSCYNDSLVLFDSEPHCVLSNNKIKNPIFNGTFNAFSSIKKNRNVKCFNGGLKQLNNNYVQKTMAVQFADCGNSFVVKNKQYTEEKINILSGRSYRNNLNSFISIFTSNVGTDKQVNRHKMFKRTINSLGRSPITRDNLFNNVQTLTSNSGPYRLFDLNGYPLTDSAGNVLKDPYGKSLVDFDLTGFPKGEAKIFDAAGNTPKDVNFDPTQKPKTNTIVLKLTDNFRRPLHLFDKYGRPLTDSYGKLLVNVHGRPLLRFDNFGQPNTDYRGGPLYTENGLRWSPKNNQSKDEFANGGDTLKPINPILNNSGNEFSDSFENVSPRQGSPRNSKKEDCKKDDINENDVVNLNTSSDIWSQLEMILKNLPKKKKIEPKFSTTSLIVNNVSVLHNPLEKELMESIINLNNFEDAFNKVDTNAKLNNNKHIQCLENFKNDTTRNDQFNEIMLGMQRKEIISNILCPDASPLLFKSDRFIKDASKCLANDNLAYQQDYSKNKSIILNYNAGDASLKKDMLFKKCDDINTTEAQLSLNSKKLQQHRNQNCLYNMYNGMLGDYNEYRKHTVSPLDSTVTTNGNNCSSDLSQSHLTSTDSSKRTTVMLTSSESPMIMTTDYSVRSSNKLQDYNNYSRSKHTENFGKPNKIKKNNDIDNTNNKTYGEHSENNCTGKLERKDELQLSQKKVQLPLRLLEKSDRLYELKIAEMILQSLDNDARKRIEENKVLPLERDATNKRDSVKVNSNTNPDALNIGCKNINSRNKLINETNNLETITLPKKSKINYDSLYRFNPNKEGGNEKNNIEAECNLEGSDKTSSNMKSSEINSYHLQYVNSNEQYIHQIKSEKQFQRQNSTKIEYYHDSVLRSPNEQGKGKMNQFKNQYTEKKYVHIAEKSVPKSKECNFVEFLGSPVKFVLNKLDLTRSSRPKPNRTNRLPKKTNKQTLDAPNQGDCNQYKHHNKNIVNYNKEKDKTRHKVSINKRQLLAFKSKSCIEISNNEKTPVTMSYSGNEDSIQKHTHLSPKNVIPGGTELRRYSSAISCLYERCEGDMREQDKNTRVMSHKKHNEPYLFNLINPDHKNKNPHANRKVIKLRKAVPVQVKKYTVNHSRRQ